MIRALGLALALTFLALPARAELPDFVMDKDYENCMGGDTGNAPRATYCACVRDGMRGWDINDYMAMAQEAVAAQAAGGDPASPPGKLGDLAKACIAKAMH
jgi:hypothetical protein